MSDFPDFTPAPEWEEYFQANSYPAGNTVLEMLVSWSLKANAIAKYLSENTGTWEGLADAVSELQRETAYLIPALAVLQTQVNSLPYMPIPIYDPNAVQDDVFDATNHRIDLVGFLSTRVSTALTELLGKINYNVGVIATKMSTATYDPNEVGDDAFDSTNHNYDNTISELNSTTVKLAIDELVTLINALTGFDVYGTPSNGKSIFYDGANARPQWLDAYDKSTIDGLLGNKITPVTDTWKNLTLDASFVSVGGSGTIRYRLNKIGQLELDIINLFTVGSTPVVGVLPVGYRPTTIRYIDQTYALDSIDYTPFVIAATLSSNGTLSIADANFTLDGWYSKFFIIGLD